MLCVVSAANINLQIIYEPLTALCPHLLLKKSGLWAWQGQQPGLPGLQCSWHLACAASPSPLTLDGALHHHMLVQTGVGGGWTSTEQEPQGTVGQMPLLDFICSILEILKMDLSSDYLVVNDIWHFYHGLIILLLLYDFFKWPRKRFVSLGM